MSALQDLKLLSRASTNRMEQGRVRKARLVSESSVAAENIASPPIIENHHLTNTIHILNIQSCTNQHPAHLLHQGLPQVTGLLESSF